MVSIPLSYPHLKDLLKPVPAHLALSTHWMAGLSPSLIDTLGLRPLARLAAGLLDLWPGFHLECTHLFIQSVCPEYLLCTRPSSRNGPAVENRTESTQEATCLEKANKPLSSMSDDDVHTPPSCPPALPDHRGRAKGHALQPTHRRRAVTCSPRDPGRRRTGQPQSGVSSPSVPLSASALSAQESCVGFIPALPLTGQAAPPL